MDERDPNLPSMSGAADPLVLSTAHCPVSVGTRLIGDRWSLLIVREILVGAVRFNAIHRGLPALSRSLLVSRLRYLERIGVVEHLVDEETPARGAYRLTSSGLALRPVLEAFGAWALDWQLPPTSAGDVNVSALMWQMYHGLDRAALPSSELTIAFRFPGSKPSSAWIHAGASDAGACIGVAEGVVDLTVVVEARILYELWWGRRRCEQAIAAGDVGFDGPTHLARAYTSWFRPAAVA